MHFRSLLVTGLVLPALATAVVAASSFRNPVRAGDYPDPSMIRVGDDYWAMATSSEWAPHFPILHSRDLVNWEVQGHVFDALPGWAKANFWAPEIATDGGKFFAYYVARDAASNRLAVAVATADRPEGPYQDHGVLVAQEAGSIDPVPFTDANGVRWLLWKEDGNSRKQPTPIWIQRLRADGLALVGERREILRNDSPWEGAVVEGPFVVRQGGYYYLFYSGAACCGRNCNYALGVARAKDMLGPWEKCPANPILADNATWRCPGHGSLVEDKAGRWWLLYHAYAANGFVATGRQMLLDEVVFGANGWPSINGGRGPTTQAAAPGPVPAQTDLSQFRDEFTGGSLAPGWQWPIGRKPRATLAGGSLTLTVEDGPATAAQSITVPSFVAETAVERASLGAGVWGGLAVYGDRANSLSLVTDGQRVQVRSQRRGEQATVADAAAAAGATIRLRIASIDGNRFRFAVQDARGGWIELGGETDGSFLPPWDRGVRAGVVVSGNPGAKAAFAYFASSPDDGKLFVK
ncbi:MAG: family 43 glycosylhydrolase [Verrucomicrobia bacterium]|nr:family 43 glycosylhydrolase [Verrucomicrobiota bacterium]